MTAGKRTRLLQTLTTTQLDRRRIDRQLRVMERRTINTLRTLKPDATDASHRLRGYASPSEAQLAHLLLRADLWIAKGQTHASTRDLRPTDDGIRAYRAVHALIQIRDARTHLDDNNAPRAAYAAMQAAVLGGDLLLHALTNAVTLAAARRRGGATSNAHFHEQRQRCLQEATRLRNSHPGWSKIDIARQILKTMALADGERTNGTKPPVALRTVRRWIQRH